MPEDISQWSLLLEYGPLGAIVIALAIWSVKQEKVKQELYKEFKDLQEKRLEESKEQTADYYKLMESVRVTLDNLKDTIKNLSDRL